MVVVTAGTGGAHKVLLISGKHSAASGATQGGYSRSISLMIPNQPSSDSDSTISGPPLRKRQRLTHLSGEEKALRRKLKNRVAAQTARDRKKAKMGDLEQQVLELELENEKVHVENRLLREKTSDLLSENEELRQRLGLDTLEEKEKVQVLEAAVSDLGLVTGSSESAALRLRVPPQQVQTQQSPNLKTSPWILTALAVQTLSLISCLVFWTSLTQSSSSRQNSQKHMNPSKSLCWLGVQESKYLPPHLQLWGPHQLSWKPLMN
uniref:X-box-binding protein 1 n=1 Tax=Cyprinus carpio TaxID=7962 RepID=A0A1V0D959_CYPCA|nr:XBP1u [Cyprinus carpio]